MRRSSQSAWELYDLNKDMGETTDLAKSRPDLLQTLIGKFETWHSSVKYPLPEIVSHFMYIHWCIGLLAVFACASPGLSRAAPAKPVPLWRVGAASVCITPETPMWLAGYPAERHKPYERVGLDVFAKALWLDDTVGHRLAIITLDLHGITPAMRQNLERAAAQRLGLKPHELMLNASHTHCGPEIRDPLIAQPELRGERVKLAVKYQGELQAKLTALLEAASRAAKPAILSYGLGKAGFAINRRPDFSLPADHPNAGLGQNPWGPVDHDVPVLQAEDASGRTLAVLFGYACHNTTLNGDQVNADYAGYAQRALERKFPGCTALFMMGCGGDQNPWPRRKVELAEQHGQTLANAVIGAMAAMRVTIGSGLRSALGSIDLDYAPAPSRETLTRRLSSKTRFEANHARLLLAQLERDGQLARSYPLPIQVVRLGRELTLFGLGGETVVDYSLRLKREFAGTGHVWVAGYCNDVVCYIPSERVLAEGGYEGALSMRVVETMGLHPGPWAPGLEDRIVGKVHELRAKTAAP